MRKIMIMAMTGIAALTATAANAQDRYYGDRYQSGGYQDSRAYDGDGSRGFDRTARDICSGRRAQQLESDLDSRVRDGIVGRYDARQIHRQIDNYEHYQRIACSSGNPRLIRQFDSRYDMMQDRIEQASRRDRRY